MHPGLHSRAVVLCAPSKLRSICQQKYAAALVTGGGASQCHTPPTRNVHFQRGSRTPQTPMNLEKSVGKFSTPVRRISNENSKKISESTILLQEGTEFQEVPMAILKSNACEGLEKTKEGPPKPYIELDPREEAAFVECFNSYHTPQEVLKILDTIPSQEVTPFVAYSILKKLFELESNFGFRNEGKSWVVTSANGKQETFARAAIIGRLMNIIMSTDNTGLLLDTLDVLRSEKSQLFYHDSDEFMNYRCRLCECVLVKVTEGQLTLLETCRAVCSFGQMTKDKNFQIDNKFVDKLWVGIMDKSGEVNTDNIVHVFKTVQYFTKCQRLVCGLVEKNLKTLWWKMDAEAVAQMCEIIGTNKRNDERWTWCISGQIYVHLSKCTSLNMHQVTEEQLMKIIKCFHYHDFCDNVFRTALNKYVKAKWMKITKPELVATIADYAKNFRLRLPPMLEGIAEYAIQCDGKVLSPPVITSVITCLGDLNYSPRNGVQFWGKMERLIDEKFVRFTPADIISILLACTYLQKYPLNFVGRIFSPYFLDRIHGTETNFSDLQFQRSRLKLLDTSLALDCGPKYGGPFLPKDYSAKNFFLDGRVHRMVSEISDPLADLCQHKCTVLTRVIIPTLPLNNLYVADLLVIPFRGSEGQIHSYLRSKISREDPSLNDMICFIVHIPEHYSSDGNVLSGPQFMRIRHLEKVGFQVVSCKYDVLSDIVRDSKTLQEFLRQTFGAFSLPGL